MQRLNHRRFSPQQRHGFTLLEIMLVLIILVVVGGIVATNYLGVQEGAMKKTATTQLQLFRQTLKLYQLDVGQLPSSLDALRERPGELADPSRWSGPYLEADITPDPWGNEYQFKVSGSGFELSSHGPDGQAGTEDDVIVKKE